MTPQNDKARVEFLNKKEAGSGTWIVVGAMVFIIALTTLLLLGIHWS